MTSLFQVVLYSFSFGSAFESGATFFESPVSAVLSSLFLTESFLTAFFVPPTGGLDPPHQPPEDEGAPHPVQMKQPKIAVDKIAFRMKFPCENIREMIRDVYSIVVNHLTENHPN